MVHVPAEKLLQEVHLGKLIFVLVNLLVQSELGLISVDPDHALHNDLLYDEDDIPKNTQDWVPLHDMAATPPRTRPQVHLGFILPPAPTHDLYPSFSRERVGQLVT